MMMMIVMIVIIAILLTVYFSFVSPKTIVYLSLKPFRAD